MPLLAPGWATWTSEPRLSFTPTEGALRGPFGASGTSAPPPARVRSSGRALRYRDCVSQPPPPPWGPTSSGAWGEPGDGGWGSAPSGWGTPQPVPAAPSPHDPWAQQPGGWGDPAAQQWASPSPSAAWQAYGASQPVAYAGFWRRFWGLHADGVLVNLCTAIVNLIFFIVTIVLGSGLKTCDRFRVGQYVFERCSTSPTMLWGLLIGNVVVNLIVWYRVIPRAMGRDGHTWGMGQMGLRIADGHTEGILGPGLAVWRAILAGVFQVVPAIAATVVLVLADRDGDLHASLIMLWVVVVTVLMLLPVGWSLVDPKRQTLYDKAVGSVVWRVADVNWFAVAAWGCTFLLPIFPLGIGFGHAAQAHARQTRNSTGSGMASAALFLSYLQLVVVLLVVLVRFVVAD